jgi:hypothetical protein
MVRPVRADSSRRLLVFGVVLPLIQSDTVGCDTSSSRANDSCVVADSSSQRFSLSMVPRIGDSYKSAIGRPYVAARHNQAVRRTSQRTVWDRVREAMLDKRMKPTQAAAAALVGIKQPSIQDWKQPNGYPTMERAVDLARKLDVNVEWLLTERGPKRPIPQDATAQRLWDIWPRLDDVTKGELVGMALGRLQRPSAEPEEIYQPDRQSLTP